jgi:hypothetical protein
LLLTAGDARAQVTGGITGNDILQSCQAHLRKQRSYIGGVCQGAVYSLFVFSERLELCIPDGVIVGQAFRVVVGYMERNPARLHLEFPDLVIEALREAWPCRR